MTEQNYTLLCDFYELTMGGGYFKNGFSDRITYFDVFFRRVPDNGGFAICAGLEQIINYINNLHFTKEDIDFLRSKGIFDEDFLTYLADLRFTGDIYAVPEGTPIFPGEPILTVRAPAAQAQLIETYVLLELNHQSLIATKANRIVRAAKGRPVLEFGSRRAHGASAAIVGARAAYIGGCAGTACTVTEQEFGVPAGGTMAHSWIQMFDTEYEAFCAYCKMYPHGAVLLVDTYNTLESGVPNAIRAFKEILVPQGISDFGIRLDSGDIAYLTKKARKMLDDAGLTTAKIVVSNALDEYLINDLLLQGACINTFGVGERLITAKSDPVFGAVYKLVAVNRDKVCLPKIKVSETFEKITNPGQKRVWRVYNPDGYAVADLITMADEVPDPSQPIPYVDPEKPWKSMAFTDCTVRELQETVMVDGRRTKPSPSIEQVRRYVKQQLEREIWPEEQRLENPHTHYLDMSPAYYQMKMELLKAAQATKI